jgi:hypothetical protein
MLWQVLGYNLTSPSPDFAVYLLQIIGAYWVVELAADQGQCATDGVLRSWAILLVVAVSVTIKLSFLGFAAGLLLALVALRFGQPALRWESIRKVASLATVIAVSTVGVWMLRGVLLSGYPAYPLPFLGLPVDWAASPEEVLDQFNMLRAWGWVPNVHWKEVLDNWDWFAPWIKHLASNRFVVVQPFALVGAATLIIVLRQVRHQPIRERIDALWPILLPPVTGTVYWLVSAPAARPR